MPFDEYYANVREEERAKVSESERNANSSMKYFFYFEFNAKFGKISLARPRQPIFDIVQCNISNGKCVLLDFNRAENRIKNTICILIDKNEKKCIFIIDLE